MIADDDHFRTAARAALLALALLLVTLAGCGSDDAGDTLQRIRESKVLRVGYANEAPYAYLDSASGALTGEAPEIARVIAARLGDGIEVEGVLTEFGSLIPGLKAGRFDVIAAGMYITPERATQISFTRPTYGIGEGFLVAPGNPKKLHSYEDIAKDGALRLGLVAGTVERGYARACGIQDEQVVTFPDAPSALEGLTAGRIDAYAGTSLTVQDLLGKAAPGTVERAEPFTDPVIDGASIRGYGAFGLRKEDAALLAEFNRHLSNFLNSPEHLALVKPFGFTVSEMPGDITAETLTGSK